MLAQQMPFAAVARSVGESRHRVHAICRRYVDLALAEADLSGLSSLTIDETSYRRGHSYLTLVADADARKVVFVSKGRGADNIAGFVLFQAAKRKARGYTRLQTMKTVLFLIAGKLDFKAINPHAA